MAIAALRLKILPVGLDTSLDVIKVEALKIMEALGALNTTFVEEPIAFGLKALIVQTAWPEAEDTDKAENGLSVIDGVSNVEIIDYRRAFG
ncbi:elongation factor 1-beta [Candidatus Pacearchaeota archaeon CG10_big_fil_rev_8_21_14_0_10_35_13]|nr:MAG: elongation factor 1-beta [Candidatus Pacearchaeota archaeon CG10_big_fil_rev_8_21_14_0_10_35_13]